MKIIAITRFAKNLPPIKPQSKPQPKPIAPFFNIFKRLPDMSPSMPLIVVHNNTFKKTTIIVKAAVLSLLPSIKT